MIEINLLPDVKQELVRAQIQRNVVISISVIVSIAVIVVTVLIALYVYVAQGVTMASLNKSIDSEYTKLSSVEDIDKMLTIENQLTAVSQLNQGKYVMSRLYGMLNVIVPKSPNKITLSTVTIDPPEVDLEDDEDSGENTVITVEGQTVGSFASLEVFEKMIAAAVIEYKPINDSVDMSGDFYCGDEGYQCKYLTIGGGDRVTAVDVSEMNYGEDQNGARTLYFKLSFEVVPELLSNEVKDVRVKIGKDGNVTDSYLGVPRAIFAERIDGGS